MLINLSNHPANRTETDKREWERLQKLAAEQRYGSIKDIPFPNIPPEWTTEELMKEALRYYTICTDIFKDLSQEYNGVHLTGEPIFCFLLAQMLLKAGYECIVSTTERIVENQADGSKISVFKFKKFRNYILI